MIPQRGRTSTTGRSGRAWLVTASTDHQERDQPSPFANVLCARRGVRERALLRFGTGGRGRFSSRRIHWRARRQCFETVHSDTSSSAAVSRIVSPRRHRHSTMWAHRGCSRSRQASRSVQSDRSRAVASPRSASPSSGTGVPARFRADAARAWSMSRRRMVCVTAPTRCPVPRHRISWYRTSLRYASCTRSVLSKGCPGR